MSTSNLSASISSSRRDCLCLCLQVIHSGSEKRIPPLQLQLSLQELLLQVLHVKYVCLTFILYILALPFLSSTRIPLLQLRLSLQDLLLLVLHVISYILALPFLSSTCIPLLQLQLSQFCMYIHVSLPISYCISLPCLFSHVRVGIPEHFQWKVCGCVS